MPKVTIVLLDDWTALYVDGILKEQNHSLRPEEVLRAVGIERQILYLPEFNEDELLPEKLEDLIDESV